MIANPVGSRQCASSERQVVESRAYVETGRIVYYFPRIPNATEACRGRSSFNLINTFLNFQNVRVGHRKQQGSGSVHARNPVR